ncbi:kinase-like protein, partial [Mycena latifolia]
MVYRGTWNRTDVAIKVLHTAAGVTPSLVLLRKEIDVCVHSAFLGANTLDDRPFIVMPYIPNNARQFLKQQPASDPVYILRDISLGLQYLHSRKICHGDIKGVNILVEDSGRSLLCDFGLSRVKADITTRTSHGGNTATTGSCNWMAPELLAGSMPRMASDVYAFGMTIYELYTDETPLASIAPMDFIELVFRLGVRPTRPEIDDVPKLTDPLWNLAELCWLHDAKARPTA